ncbi:MULTISPECIES: hypothetical protein [unclassified Thalassospira]|jgi:hypothetical protein|uniref:hypothetical protein n=1 Tax=unclassified Thalassospira TaxID=2648997 RepID=UPI001B008EF1|nr:hypothetical protein [Thalassospira sp.]MBO6773799.1 hypothetical protein [Thalassospira sp.]|tara:strand:+ start:4231 stop:4587 length:357 start_codon:yes stop_codon:yes gene_type:complete
MIFKDWEDGFGAFITEFEAYLDHFPDYGGHEKYLAKYREALDLVRTQGREKCRGKPFLDLHCAIMLLLDGRQKLTPPQKDRRATLVFRWKQLERSSSAKPAGRGHRIGYPANVYLKDS